MYTNGAVGLGMTGRNYDVYSGVAGFQLAMTKWAAAFIDYNYYHYQFDPAVVLPAGMNRGLDRQSVRGGVNLWVPLLR